MCIYTYFFFFNDTATTEIYTLSLHDALPISLPRAAPGVVGDGGNLPPHNFSCDHLDLDPHEAGLVDNLHRGRACAGDAHRVLAHNSEKDGGCRIRADADVDLAADYQLGVRVGFCVGDVALPVNLPAGWIDGGRHRVVCSLQLCAGHVDLRQLAALQIGEALGLEAWGDETEVVAFRRVASILLHLVPDHVAALAPELGFDGQRIGRSAGPERTERL